jgi:hypothetical protein
MGWAINFALKSSQESLQEKASEMERVGVESENK